ncbi:TM2 domain-containing protein [Prevotella sp. OH937_COT-195]|uniref:TM2 domain-containing protein n=1 Tax=Prevotella sp. OH937_COT-195 TaxID=2491051 RepID=UPI000F64BF27|nr:TM2 domain-containing protein [Prevotella sp. OH937_COT-195]RRC98427.1 TM2 domain-containing protein [Prevotella sp. OH937_COT-195]
MDQNRINAFLVLNQDNLPAEYMPMIRQRLEVMDDSKSFVLMSINLKNPFVALILSLFLGTFGIDRFYIGDYTNGMIKLLMGIVVLPTISVLTLGFGFILYAGYIIDWFLIMGAAKKNNAKKMMMYL